MQDETQAGTATAAAETTTSAAPSAADLDADANEKQAAAETAAAPAADNANNAPPPAEAAAPAPPEPEEEESPLDNRKAFEKLVGDFHQALQIHNEALTHLKTSSNAGHPGTIVHDAVVKFEAAAKRLDTVFTKLKKEL